MRRKFKIGLLITTAVLLVSFIITLFNPFVDDDVRRYAVKNYYEITFTEGETRYDEDYFSIEIKNVSGDDVFNNEEPVYSAVGIGLISGSSSQITKTVVCVPS